MDLVIPLTRRILQVTHICEVLFSLTNQNRLLDHSYHPIDIYGHKLATLQLIMFDFILALLEHDFMSSGNGRSSTNTNNSKEGCKARKSKKVPLHPFQSFAKVCERIEKNDPILTVVEFRDEFLNVRRLAHAVAKNTHITELNLIQSIRDRETRDSRPRSAPAHDVLHLCMEGLRHNTSIISLDLTETTVRASGAAFVSRGVQQHPKLKHLRLARCLLQDEGLRRMSAAPLGKELIELDISGNTLADGTAILQMVLNNPHLVSLDISNNSLSMKGMEQFVGFGGFHSLEKCDMSRNNIRRDALQSLGTALGDQKCRLKELCLDANEMMDCTMESISFGLLSNSSLEKLSLNNNYLGDVGVMKIAISIGMNPNSKMRELRLSGNKIHNAGAISLMKHTSNILVKLDLSGNRITDGRSICKVLRKDNISMRELSMTRNPIPLQHSHEIEFWTRLNASGGRQLLSNSGDSKLDGYSMNVWPKVLSRISEDPNGLYYFLIRKPELCLSASSTEHNPYYAVS
mmetsp:Transcript_2169/g.3932  ORF Transcript_2169/g.3932 Transcript_2169/m.3932 type:complete len:517 (-) Transcript_2169:2297-3847(-)